MIRKLIKDILSVIRHLYLVAYKNFFSWDIYEYFILSVFSIFVLNIINNSLPNNTWLIGKPLDFPIDLLNISLLTNAYDKQSLLGAFTYPLRAICFLLFSFIYMWSSTLCIARLAVWMDAEIGINSAPSVIIKVFCVIQGFLPWAITFVMLPFFVVGYIFVFLSELINKVKSLF